MSDSLEELEQEENDLIADFEDGVVDAKYFNRFMRRIKSHKHKIYKRMQNNKIDHIEKTKISDKYIDYEDE